MKPLSQDLVQTVEQAFRDHPQSSCITLALTDLNVLAMLLREAAMLRHHDGREMSAVYIVWALCNSRQQQVLEAAQRAAPYAELLQRIIEYCNQANEENNPV